MQRSEIKKVVEVSKRTCRGRVAVGWSNGELWIMDKDGRTLVVACTGHALRIWRVPSFEEIEQSKEVSLQ